MPALSHDNRLQKSNLVHWFIVADAVDRINQHHHFILVVDAKFIEYARYYVEILRDFVLGELGADFAGREKSVVDEQFDEDKVDQCCLLQVLIRWNVPECRRDAVYFKLLLGQEGLRAAVVAVSAQEINWLQ